MNQANSVHITLLVILVLVVAGIGIVIFQESLFGPADGNSETLSRAVSTEWKTYINTKYGFAFKYPANRTAYERIDIAAQKLISASPGSDFVAVALREGDYAFTSEAQGVSATVIHERTDARGWFNAHTAELTNQGKAESISSVTFGGRKALEIRGEAGSGDAYRLVIVQFPDYLIVVHQNAKSSILDDVMNTFKFQ